uniref:DegT/DnrJ/EryC1/StrS aminotransferase family protein n=1 Tax=viral metagenome TaxID=1070528 RepID=A0A6C0DXX8_9ZZZZ
MIPLFKVFISEDVKDPLISTLYSGSITQGPRVEEFESKLSDMFNHPYILTLNSATSGLTMALRMIKDDFEEDGIGISTDDEVLTVPLTCMATNIPIMANNMNIKWVDVDRETGLIDLKDLEQKITVKTKIIMFVHWGGYPVDLDAINSILDKKEKEIGFRPKIIEDCAHAFLSEYKGKKLGTTGNYAVFSLQAIKHLTTGDGGLLFCPTKDSYDKGKLLRWYGIDRSKRNYKGKDLRLEADVSDWGYKFHMNDVNATIGLYNLPHIPSLIEKDRYNGKYFDENIKNPKIKIVQPYTENSKSAYWLYTVQVEEKANFIEHMKQNNIMASQVHQRNDVHSCFEKFKSDLPNLDFVEKHIVCIPVGWWLSNEDRNHIVSTCNSF